MNLNLVLAKTSPEKSLLEHTEEVLKVLSQIMKIYPAAPKICELDELWECVFYAIFFHDFGKAASGFQNYLKGRPGWNYRHEILSAGFVSTLDYDDELKKYIALGIISHHKELDEIRAGYSTDNPNNPAYQRYVKAIAELEENFDYLKFLMSHIPDFSLKYIGKKLENFRVPESVFELIDAYKFAVKGYLNDVANGTIDDVKRRRRIFIRDFVLACDHLASTDKIEIPIFDKRISDVLKFHNFNDVQIKSAKMDKDIIIIAPTGYGKTEASLLWVDVNKKNNVGRRVFYILPYTASINAIFERFVNYFGSEFVGIRHHRVGYFVYKSFRDRGYSLEESLKFAKAFQDLNRKIYNQFKFMTHLQLVKELFGV